MTFKCRSEIMSNIPAKGKKPEMAVCRLIHAIGFTAEISRESRTSYSQLGEE